MDSPFSPDARYEFDAPSFFDFSQASLAGGSSSYALEHDAEEVDSWFDGRAEDGERHAPDGPTLLTPEELEEIRHERELRERQAVLHEDAVRAAEDAEAVAWTRATEAAFEAQAMAEKVQEHRGMAEQCNEEAEALADAEIGHYEEQEFAASLSQYAGAAAAAKQQQHPEDSEADEVVLEEESENDYGATDLEVESSHHAEEMLHAAQRAAQAFLDRGSDSVSDAVAGSSSSATNNARRASSKLKATRRAVSSMVPAELRHSSGAMRVHSSGAMRVAPRPTSSSSSSSSLSASSSSATGTHKAMIDDDTAPHAVARPANSRPMVRAPAGAAAVATTQQPTIRSSAASRPRKNTTAAAANTGSYARHTFRRAKVESTEERILREAEEARARLRQNRKRNVAARTTFQRHTARQAPEVVAPRQQRQASNMPRRLTKPKSPKFASSARTAMHSARAQAAERQQPANNRGSSSSSRANARPQARPAAQPRQRKLTEPKPFALSTSNRQSRMQDHRETERPLHNNFKRSEQQRSNRTTTNNKFREAAGGNRIQAGRSSPQRFYGFDDSFSSSSRSRPSSRRASKLTIPHSPKFASARRAEMRSSLASQRGDDFSEFAAGDSFGRSGRRDSSVRTSNVAFGSSWKASAAEPKSTPRRRGPTKFAEFTLSTETRSRQRRAFDEDFAAEFDVANSAEAESSFLGRGGASSARTSRAGSRPSTGASGRQSIGRKRSAGSTGSRSSTAMAYEMAPDAKRARSDWKPAVDNNYGSMVENRDEATGMRSPNQKIFGGRLRQALNAIRNA